MRIHRPTLALLAVGLLVASVVGLRLTTAGTGGWAGGADAAPPSEGAAPPDGTALARETPEAEAARFEREVVRHLRASTGGEARVQRDVARAVEGDAATASRMTGARPLAAVARGGGMGGGARGRAAAVRERLRNDPAVDWGYLQDVWAGRISGIPDEGRAGATLQEIDAAGEVPYFESLRKTGDDASLDDLGLPRQRNLPVCTKSAHDALPTCTVL